MEGWIKLYRRIKENPLWSEDRRFSRLEAWLDMLLRANHKSTVILLGADSYQLTAGQFITSQLKLAVAWRWNRETVKAFLDYLRRERSISYETSNRKTIITILNWDIYQNEDYHNPATRPAAKPARTQHQSQHEPGTDNNDKNENNEKNKKSVFAWPTLEEVKAYCLERKNQVDSEAFFNFYESKGWMIGSNKLKDWRAAVRTWERRNKEQGRPAGGNGKAVNWDRLIEDRLGRIATDGMIKAMMREMPQIFWWKIEQFLKKRYPGSNGTAFLRIESELIREEQDAGNLNSAICEGKTEAVTVGAP